MQKNEKRVAVSCAAVSTLPLGFFLAFLLMVFAFSLLAFWLTFFGFILPSFRSLWHVLLLIALAFAPGLSASLFLCLPHFFLAMFVCALVGRVSPSSLPSLCIWLMLLSLTLPERPALLRAAFALAGHQKKDHRQGIERCREDRDNERQADGKEEKMRTRRTEKQM